MTNDETAGAVDQTVDHIKQVVSPDITNAQVEAEKVVKSDVDTAKVEEVKPSSEREAKQDNDITKDDKSSINQQEASPLDNSPASQEASQKTDAQPSTELHQEETPKDTSHESSPKPTPQESTHKEEHVPQESAQPSQEQAPPQVVGQQDHNSQEEQPPVISPDTKVTAEITTPDSNINVESKSVEVTNEAPEETMGGPRKRSNNKERRKFGIGGGRRPANGVFEHASRLVGEYQIGNTIGRGCFGHTLTGINVNTNESVVIKQLDPKKTPKECHETLKREIQTLISLNHPNIVTYKSVELDDYAYIVMEQVENGSISDTLQKFGPFPEPLAAQYTSQILAALEILNEHNIIHRNLKGSNALLKNGVVQLSDFYVAAKDDERKYLIAGSPYWMAPELFDMSSPSCASDIWSLGCLVLEMFTGSPPYRNLPPMAAILQLVREGFALPTGLPAELQDFLGHCFQKDPKQRKDAKFLRKHAWIQRHENAKKEISEYPSRQPASSAQAAPLDEKSNIHIDVLSDKDKEDIALAEFILAPTDTDGASSQTVQESFQFKKSSTIPSSTNSNSTGNINDLKQEIEKLRKLNDQNVDLANELKAELEQVVSDQYTLARLATQQVKRVEVAEEQLSGVARSTAHSNMLLKRTNQLATDAISKNNIIAINIKRIEEVILEGDSGPKKLATLLYRKLAADSLINLAISANLSYSSSVKTWKEKRGWFVVKDNFLFIYKSDKGSTPQDIIYLGDGARLSPLSEEQIKRKYCFKLGEAFLIATDTPEQYTEWMLALSCPQKWYESSEEMTRPKVEKTRGFTKSGSDSPSALTRHQQQQYRQTPPPSPVEPHKAVFGVSLEELFRRENGNVPTFYTDMITFLQDKALHEEGILRLSGGVSEINLMRIQLQNGEKVDFYTHDHNAVAGLLKCFFRELPDPIIPEPYHTNTYELMSNNDMLDEQRVVELKMILDQLPPENYAVLQILMNFLVQVNMAADKNKMTVQNLITCMVPTLKCVPGVFMYAIPNYDFIFGNWEGEDSAVSVASQ